MIRALPDERPTHFDLFSGIGGFALAAKWAGFRTIGFCEIDQYCQKVLAKNFPSVTNRGDIRSIKERIEADLLTGGFPCQPTSHAGKRLGDRDPRWLWPEMSRVISLCRPAWILAENPIGLVTWQGGILLDQVYFDLEAEGYSTLPPLVIPACAVDAIHRRDRVWICAHINERGRGTESRQQQTQRAEVTHRICANGSNAALLLGQEKLGSKSHGDLSGDEVAPDNHDTRRVEQWGAKSVGQKQSPAERRCRWAAEPGVGRMVHGIPARVDRLRGLGNAIVPQVAFQILKAIRNQCAPS